MSIKKITKEELETMSYNEIAYMLLKEEKEQTTADLFQKIVDLLGLPKKTFENKIGDFYTSLTTDQRFIMLEDGNWDLRVNHKVADLINTDDLEDYDEVESDYDDEPETDEEEENYDDTDEEDTSDEYKNLVIIDEEELGQEE